MMQLVPDTLSHPDQLPKLDPAFGVAVNVTGVPVAKIAAHTVGQLMPAGELVTDPLPVTDTVTAAPPPLLPIKHTTLTVIVPVTMAPFEWTVPSLLVVTVADTRPVPQSWPVAVSRPEELTVAMPGVLDTQVT